MIRFRFAEDEKRYLLLVSAIQRQLATRLPPAEVSVAMRNLGKLQDLLMMEGVRQGAVAAGLARCDGAPELVERMPPFQLHATVYGSQDTPMHLAEQEWIRDALHLDVGAMCEQSWLDAQPMQFAPDTLQAAEVTEQAPGAPASVPAPTRKPLDSWTDDDIAAEARRWASQVKEGDAQEHPDLLDRVRDVLQDLRKEGFRPTAWAEMIMRVHLATQVDAGFLDLQLGTPMGITVLRQAGFLDLDPPGSFDQITFLEQLPGGESAQD